MSSTLQVGSIVSHYQINSVLGVGGFGITYEARDMRNGKTIALKENFPSNLASRNSDGCVVCEIQNKKEFAWAMDKFVQEAQVLSRMSHPGVVRVYDAFKTNGTAYFAMEYLKAKALDKLVPPGGQWCEKDLRRVLTGMLYALAYVHGEGVYHRDIKPANIMVRHGSLDPVLIDFGSAKPESTIGTNTRAFESRGYTAPEQYKSDDSLLGAWSDVYALGATMHYLLTGRTPRPAFERMIQDDYVPLATGLLARRGFSAAFLATVDKALLVNVAHRFQSAREWLRALDGAPAEARKAASERKSSGLFWSFGRRKSKPVAAVHHVKSLPGIKTSPKSKTDPSDKVKRRHDDRSYSMPNKDESVTYQSPKLHPKYSELYRKLGWWFTLGGLALVMLLFATLADSKSYGGTDFLFPVAVILPVTGLSLLSFHGVFFSGSRTGKKRKNK